MSSKPKIYVTRILTPTFQDRLEALKSKYDIRQWTEDSLIPRPIMLEAIKGSAGVIVLITNQVDQDFLDAAGPTLKVVSTMSVGYDHVNITLCKSREIRIGNTPDVLTDTTAELAIALLLATARRFGEAAASVKNGTWGPWEPNGMLGSQIRGKTMGIVGLGRLGFGVLEKIQGFKLSTLLYYNPREKRDLAKKVNAIYSPSLDALLSQSDFVVITSPYNDKTHHMINASTLAKMKKTAVLINISRGGLVNQEDLYVALKNGVIAYAGLDVTTPEPLSTSSPLLTLDNCFVIPHIGSATIEAREAMANLALDNCIAALEDKAMPAEIL
ncbi:hypothetical protein SmJEL517_g05850 [Synchytrium microbalum]|uniref:Glyoxylate reductase n=1 Tax=Synchytrium microbalum TaxID=1806994 RepID=A0A507BUB8_9FUNG|nr:uncharacterized protein SmJEL517_g05850 [Synchytrium microbalum]TPX30629.1 hypothetical protein SmJEL517_g05850 [Synchytrium microbalum]